MACGLHLGAITIERPSGGRAGALIPGGRAILYRTWPLPPAAELWSVEGEAVYKPWSSSVSAPQPPLDRPVWVHLDRLYGPPDSPGAVADPAPGGLLVATGRVPGVLKRWARAVDGRWFGRVNFAVCDSYGAVVAEHLAVLVPADALSPRDGEARR